MAKEYIERQRAIVDACNSLELYPSEYAKLEDALNSIPAADVVEVRHAKWVSSKQYNGNPECSACFYVTDEKTNYCPNCGAYMMGESNGKCE